MQTLRTLTGRVSRLGFFFEQALKKFYQSVDFFFTQIVVSLTVSVMTKPKFKVFNTIVRFITVLMMNCFGWKKITTNMLLHYYSMLLNIAILRVRVICHSDHHITFRRKAATAFPKVMKLASSIITPLFSATSSAKTSKGFTLQSSSDLIDGNSFYLGTFPTFSFNNKLIALIFIIFKVLRIELKQISKFFANFRRFQWFNAHNTSIISFKVLLVQGVNKFHLAFICKLKNALIPHQTQSGLEGVSGLGEF